MSLFYFFIFHYCILCLIFSTWFCCFRLSVVSCYWPKIWHKKSSKNKLPQGTWDQAGSLKLLLTYWKTLTVGWPPGFKRWNFILSFWNHPGPLITNNSLLRWLYSNWSLPEYDVHNKDKQGIFTRNVFLFWKKRVCARWSASYSYTKIQCKFWRKLILKKIK